MTMVTAVMTSPAAPIDVDEDQDDASIDQEQLDEYREMVEQLGNFPDKIKINSLTMVAEDHSDTKASAAAIYNIIRNRIMTTTTAANLLPLVYVLDSILKNVKGKFIPVMEQDVVNWMSIVYKQLQNPQKQKLVKMHKTWNEFGIFSPENLKAMGRCFESSAVAGTTSKVAGSTRTNTAKLLLSTQLRKEMQSLLDEMQIEMDEREKLSLERLAEIDTELLENITQVAKANIGGSNNNGGGGGLSMDTAESDADQLPPFFTEIRSPETLEQSSQWTTVKWDHVGETESLVSRLQDAVVQGASVEALYTQQESLQMTQYLAAASATAALLTSTLEQIKNPQDRKDQNSYDSFPGGENAVGGGASATRGFRVDQGKFSNNGIKVKNIAVIALLYDVGLPFVSSADGRRFATQPELAKHLDTMFKKSQIEKSMARTEERGWYTPDDVWTGETKEVDTQNVEDAVMTEAVEEEGTPESSMVPADTTRPLCVICGDTLVMITDDNGEFMYSNCREIEVLNDDAAEKESEDCLVHVRCWRGLGSPEVLTTDQVMQDTLPH